MKHKTKDGEIIQLVDLKTSHLKNIIKMHHKKAKEGLIVRYGGGSSPDDFYYEEEEIFGQDVFDELKTAEYENELKSRLRKYEMPPLDPSRSIPEQLTPEKCVRLAKEYLYGLKEKTPVFYTPTPHEASERMEIYSEGRLYKFKA